MNTLAKFLARILFVVFLFRKWWSKQFCVSEFEIIDVEHITPSKLRGKVLLLDSKGIIIDSFEDEAVVDLYDKTKRFPVATANSWYARNCASIIELTSYYIAWNNAWFSYENNKLLISGTNNKEDFLLT